MVAATATPAAAAAPIAVDVPPSDRRAYRRLTLDNGMAVLLIHDPAMAEDAAFGEGSEGEDEEGGDGARAESASDDDGAVTESDTDDGSEEDDDDDGDDDCAPAGGGKAAKKAAAAVAVGVGSLCDPLAQPGLAHYLEHMLFMGSAKYPDENE